MHINQKVADENSILLFTCATFATLKVSLLSGFCRQKKTFNMAMGEGDYKDFGPLVGAIDQGTSSSRFLVSCTSIK